MIGSDLPEERERRGLELADIETRKKIRVRYLAALEQSRYEILPGATYARAFLRDYAEALGLDPSPGLAELPALDDPAETPRRRLPGCPSLAATARGCAPRRHRRRRPARPDRPGHDHRCAGRRSAEDAGHRCVARHWPRRRAGAGSTCTGEGVPPVAPGAGDAADPVRGDRQ